MSRDLPTSGRLAGFAAVLAVGFGVAYAVGAVAAPAGLAPAAPGGAGHARTHADTAHGDGGAAPAGSAHGDHAGETAPSPAALPGLAVSQDGYTLRPAATVLDAGPAVPFAFTVTGPDGEPVTAYEPTHERDLHLVVVRRDLGTFQHVHPRLAADGTWSSPLDLSAAGTYRVIADARPTGGPALVLGVDVSVGGPFTPVPLPAPATTAEVDGYTVTLAGDPHPGRETALTFTVGRDGEPVTDLEPYLGAFGHLVALRAGDLAYLHTHPEGTAEPGAAGGPAVQFATTFPTGGEYRLHLDFQVAGQVRTAAFTVVVPAREEQP